MEQRTTPLAICWRVHLTSAPERVFAALTTPEGRRAFWAESAEEQEGVIDFRFANGDAWESRILEYEQPHRFAIEYCGGSVAAFYLADDGDGGTELTLTERGVPPDALEENRAGWVAVLLTLKGALDFNVDLRNGDSRRTWAEGYVDV